MISPVLNISTIAFIKEVNQYCVVEEATNLSSSNEPYREDEEGNCDKDNLKQGTEYSTKQTLLTYVGKYLNCSKDTVARGEDAKEETA